jgi:WD40 repeat protein
MKQIKNKSKKSNKKSVKNKIKNKGGRTILNEYPNEVLSVAFSHDEKLLAYGSDDETIKLWDISTNNLIRTLEGHTHEVLSVAFNSDGMLASGSVDNTIKLWDISTMKCVRTLEGHTSDVCSVAFNNKEMLASGSGDNTIKLWNISTMTCVGTLEGHTNTIWSVAFNSDGMLASGSADNTIKLWRVDTKQCEGTLEGHTRDVQSVAFNNNGMLASGSDDSTIKLWDTSTMTCVGTLTGHTSYVYSVAFNGAGMLASGSWDKTIKLWDISTMTCMGTLRGHNRSVNSISFNGVGMLASGSMDKKVIIWNIEDEIIDLTSVKGILKYLDKNILDIFKKYNHEGLAFDVHTKTEKYDLLNLSKNLYLYLKRKNPKYEFKEKNSNIRKFITDKLLEFYTNYNKDITDSNIGNKTRKLFNNTNNNMNIGNKTRKLFNQNNNNTNNTNNTNKNNNKLIDINKEKPNIETILNQLNYDYAKNRTGANIIFMLILDYMSLQKPELQKTYSDYFIKDCSQAYGDSGLSCPQGISERIIQTLQSILNLKQNINELEQKMLCNFVIIDVDKVLKKALEALTKELSGLMEEVSPANNNTNTNNALNTKRNNYNTKMIKLLKDKMLEQNKDNPCISKEFIDNITDVDIQKFITDNNYNYNSIFGGKLNKVRKTKKSKKSKKSQK